VKLKGILTLQRLRSMSRFGKIPGATRKGEKLWVYMDGPELRAFIRALRVRGKATWRNARSETKRQGMTASQLAKSARISTRQVQRLSRTELKQWAYLTRGGHLRFWDCAAIRSWSKGKVMEIVQRGRPHAKKNPEHRFTEAQILAHAERWADDFTRRLLQGRSPPSRA
jgi:hypothetical protein